MGRHDYRFCGWWRPWYAPTVFLSGDQLDAPQSESHFQDNPVDTGMRSFLQMVANHSESQVFELCKLPRLHAFQNVGRLPLPDGRCLSFLHSNPGRSLRMLLLHRTRLNRGTLINAICIFPRLDYFYLHGIWINDPDCKVICPAPPPLTGELTMCAHPGYPQIVAQLSILLFRFTEIQIKIRADVLDRPNVGFLIEQSSQSLCSFTILGDGPCMPLSPGEFCAFDLFFHDPLSRSMVQDNWGLAFTLSRTLGTLNLHIQLPMTTGAVTN